MTKKTKKILLIIAVSIAVIAIALAVLIKIYITPERVKAFLIPEAEKALNRKVNIGEVNISLFKGIEVKDFAIKEIDEKTDFVKCKDFILKYKFLPLLFKKVIVDELKLVSPEVRIERDREGKFNFEGIGQKQKLAEGKEEKQATKSKGLPISLLISKITVKDAKFSLIDLKKKLPDIKGSIDINMDIKSTDGTELSSRGNINMSLNEIVIKKPYEKYIENITAGLKYAASINLESNSIHIDKADIKVQKIPVSITGEILNLKTLPEIDIAISIPKLKIANIQESLIPFADIKGFSLSGNLTADLTLTGTLQEIDSLKTNGMLTLGKVGVAYNDMNVVLDGNLKFNEQSMTINLKSILGKNTAELKGSVSNYFKNQKIKLNIYSKQLFLDEIIPTGTAKGTTSAQKGKPAPNKASAEAKPLDLKLTADGEIKIDSTKYKNITMSNFYMKYQLKNNKFEIIKMTAHAGKGKFNLNSIVNLSNPGYTYTLSCNLDSLHADEIVNSFFPKAKDTVYGILSFNLKLSGSGTLPESMKRNLIANGDFNIKDGKIKNNKIAENLSLFLGIDELKTINLRQANGTIKIRNSIARLDSIFSSDDISMNPSGNIGLDETLDLAVDLKLSPRLTDKALRNSNITSYIKDDAGWGRIPLKVSGTFSDPSYSVDVAKVGKRVIKKKAKELLEDLFEKDGDKQPIHDLFKGLFK